MPSLGASVRASDPGEHRPPTRSTSSGSRQAGAARLNTELNTVTKTNGSAAQDAPPLRDRIQLYLTPGFNVRPLPRVTFRTGPVES